MYREGEYNGGEGVLLFAVVSTMSAISRLTVNNRGRQTSGGQHEQATIHVIAHKQPVRSHPVLIGWNEAPACHLICLGIIFNNS